VVPEHLTVGRLLLVLGLSAFFGIAFEEHFAGQLPGRPGGIRTFPLLAFCGAALYAVDQVHALAFVAGAVVVGWWMLTWMRDRAGPEESADGVFIVPSCNLLAYALGGLTLVAPPWASIGIAVAAALLLTGRHRLHAFARALPSDEVLTAGEFLLLIGVVLPLLRLAPAIGTTGITPYKIWLAVVAVSTLSYGSYLLQRYAFPKQGTLLGALLGGLYSSTATTVVLARRAAETAAASQLNAGIVVASSVMYLRLLIIIGIFSLPTFQVIALPFVLLALIGGALAALLSWKKGPAAPRDAPPALAPNPLQLTTALIFAALFVLVSVVSNWAQGHLGHEGVYGLAAILGLTDIDPFVLSLTQGSVHALSSLNIAVAVLIAAASNDALKAIYAVAFARTARIFPAVAALIALSALTGLGAWWLAVSRV